MNDLIAETKALLVAGTGGKAALEQVLIAVLVHFKSQTGTIHRLETEKNVLHLAAYLGLPPALLDAVKVIPSGKGIAGQVVERGEPVTICNIQKDESGVARPGAKQTGVGGALCVPLRANGVIVGTIGIGTTREYQYTPEETKLLEEVGRLVGDSMSKQAL
jgi:GAF domain-containing protein